MTKKKQNMTDKQPIETVGISRNEKRLVATRVRPKKIYKNAGCKKT
jgi:hypothetical protein